MGQASNVYADLIREKLKGFITGYGRTQASVAKELDISKTTLSQFLSGSYPGDNTEIAQRAEQFITLGTARQALAREPDFCPALNNTQTIMNLVKVIHISNDICLIYGPAGCGKSTALRHYADENKSVLYVEADVTVGTPRAILALILETMSENPRGSMSKLMREIITKLTGTNKLIIIDEAQHLSERCFDTIRAINDKAHVGIVYAGNPSVLRRMTEARHAEDFDQVYSRIGYKCELKNNFSEQDINMFYTGFDLDKICTDYLRKVSCRKGGLRLMVKQYKLAANMAASRARPLSVDLLKEADKRMGISGGIL